MKLISYESLYLDVCLCFSFVDAELRVRAKVYSLGRLAKIVFCIVQKWRSNTVVGSNFTIYNYNLAFI